MSKRDLAKERESELAAIWGTEREGEKRYPKRRGSAKKSVTFPISVIPGADVEGIDDVPSDLGSDVGSDERALARSVEKKKKAKKDRRESTSYRLHCFVGPGTERNGVRTVFEAYEPKIELRTSQQGNLLNKTHFAVLTFRNKAMALHAVKVLDGTNQYDLMGVKRLKLSLMLSRKEHMKARQKMRKRLREKMKEQAIKEAEEEAAFIKKFVETYRRSKKQKSSG
ncbi:hypothetical protein ERJ75_001196400 [Trypanosoma vivax]|uniref:RRM domain-containing protein n=1 Tax=Trypanosoma vivax (strain Y486) TaxID=1055687 RepID=G0UBS2_TRYVY|nr:hypothetical protein TRVL_08771 [Trypanosoma vivax]KAH8609524.1 hypothetical protein ERJ75_001196400 [Trypanosoma vivax]CCC53270.1 conserved hypothetical protein [Trypanosoma vivax Y486]